MHIAIIEDSETQRDHLRQLITELGHKSQEYPSGLELIECLGEQRYDLLIMDIDMPGLDGIRTSEIIKRSSDPAIRKIPIIILTASKSNVDKARATVSNAESIIFKPVNSRALEETILRVTNG